MSLSQRSVAVTLSRISDDQT